MRSMPLASPSVALWASYMRFAMSKSAFHEPSQTRVYPSCLSLQMLNAVSLRRRLDVRVAEE